MQGSILLAAPTGAGRVFVMLFAAFITFAMVIALAEIGDKTPLPAIVPVTRFNRPLLAIAGIFVAMLANHVRRAA